MRYLFSIILLFIILLSLQVVAKATPNEIEYTDINIQEINGIIYSFNIKNKEKTELVHGHTPLLSHNKTKFIYFSYFRSELPPNASLTYELYNLQTQTNQVLFEDDNEDPFGYQQWSPDDKYIVFDNGTDVVRRKTVFNIDLNKFVVDFLTTMERYAWLNENEIIFTDVDNDYSISTINLQTGKTNILIQSSEQQHYLLENIDKNKINFISFIPNNSKSAILWISDLNGKNKYKVKEIPDYWNHKR